MSHLRLALLAFVVGVALSAAAAPPLPPTVAAQLPDLKVQGGGDLSLFGVSIYDAYFYRPDGFTGAWSPEQPFALKLVYHRSLYGARIAERSVEEMTKLGYGTEAQRARWGELMKQIFPDVDDGDRLTGVNIPHRGVRFYQNGLPIGAIEDRDFARAFFAIWLDPRTSEPSLRKKLLGEE